MQVGKDLIWHQVSTRTWYNRYLLEFLICRELIDPKTILSFGCSTGEECATLQMHFPDAEITGCDINPDALSLAKERYPGYKFLFTDSKELKKGYYDAIFAMNVFHRQTENSQELPKYEREHFDLQIEQLHALLTKEGMLVLYAAQYNEPHNFKLLQTYGKLAIYQKL